MNTKKKKITQKIISKLCEETDDPQNMHRARAMVEDTIKTATAREMVETTQMLQIMHQGPNHYADSK